MKRIIQVLLIYTVILFGVFVGVSFIYGGLPELLEGAKGSYCFNRGVIWFLKFLPSVLMSGFLIGGTIQWKNEEVATKSRFSDQIKKIFQKVFFISLVIAFILTLSQEIFLPGLTRKQEKIKDNPALLSKYLNLGKEALESGQILLAYQYSEMAINILPKNQDVIEFHQKTKNLLDLATSAEKIHSKNKVENIQIKKISNPLAEKDSSFSVLEMLQKSDTAMKNNDWFDAHYWAHLAEICSSGTDVNLQKAHEMANVAWKKLSEPRKFDNKEMEDFYATKKEGYKNLNSGNFLKSYYIFNSLSNKSQLFEEDPDVKRYYNLAKERVVNNYFFIDEAEDLKKSSIKRNTYFLIRYEDGSCDMIFIRGSATLGKIGGMIQYLYGLNISSFDKNGQFVKQIDVPFAKMVEESTNIFTERQLQEMGLNDNVKSVPYIYLQAVDRNTEGIISKPTVYGKEKDIPSSIIIPMNYVDFSLINQAADGPATMDMWSLIQFVPKSTFYGFSYEVFAANLVGRASYPIFVIIILMFIASFAWNYRANSKDVFRFKWLFLFPLFTVITYIFVDCCQYLFTLLNYGCVGLCGAYAILAAVIIYIILLFISMMNFLNRRST